MGCYVKKLSLFPGLVLTATFGAGLLTLALPGQAAAMTAANAVIRNVATVNYQDAGGVDQPPVSSTPSDVTVNLVTAKPTLTAPGNQTTPSGVYVNYTYTISNNANGPDIYNLSDAYTLVSGNISHTELIRNAADNATIASIDLGATTAAAAAASGTAVLTVPNDGTADGVVNGIAADDYLVIGGIVYQVLSVVDNAPGTSATSTITLKTNLSTNVAIGDQIGEQGTFILKTTPTTSANGSQYDITITANDGVSGAVTAFTQTTVLLPVLTVSKYVQNITNPVVCPAGKVTLTTGLSGGSKDYCDSGVNGNPGNTLEYVIAVANTGGGATTANNVIISDPVPAFTTKVANTIALDPGTGTFSTGGTDAVDNDFAKVASGTVYIYAGAGGKDDGTGGTLAATKTTYGAFQVTINN